VCLLFLSLASAVTADDIYQEKSAFLAESFGGETPAPQLLWLTANVKDRSLAILGHPYPGLRIRYWRRDTRTAWVLQAIGKEKPITVGILIREDEIELIRVLVYRESRGWEVRYPFFTDQFKGAGLLDDNSLNQRIDGISGATLSVRALKKLARLALFLNTQTDALHENP
jgi:hypothetical protein